MRITLAKNRRASPPTTPFFPGTHELLQYFRFTETDAHLFPDHPSPGTHEVLECFLGNKPIREEYIIAQGGKLAGTGAKSYTQGDTTGGSGDAAKFKH